MARKGLGKGLDALFQTYENTNVDNEGRTGQGTELRINDIDPNMDQPRRHFDQESINELGKSIMEHGVVQPILVKEANGRYTIIAGERRWRAARSVGLEKIPAIILDIDDRKMLEIALIENLQREDLNPIEEAEGINNLMKEYKLTQEEVATRIGKSRSAIANTLRLLRLPDKVRRLLAENSLNPGQARALLGLEDKKTIIELAGLIVQEGLSVRQVEDLVKKHKDKGEKNKSRKTAGKPSFLLELESRMEEALGTRVNIQPGKRKGIIGIEYYSDDDLERLIEKIGGN
jgi:ParB family chromosome partitioning protein